ncbi:MAG: VCBS repeat-containing protein, partial [candidate division Zixibacteria bacterium]|nr:VCBS repeat-containing protein [candidate division Zixibacteria bacterium]
NVYPEWRFPNSSRLSHVSWGDADGDNDLDLCLVEQSDEFCIYENLGGVLSESPQWGHTPGGWPQINGWGDFDNDGLTDTTETFTGNGIRKLFVLGKMNLHKVTGIEIDGAPLDISQYCCSMVEGIISTAPTPASGSNIIVSYTFSRDIDLLGGTTGTYIYENYADRHLRASYNIETHSFEDENDDGRFESGETAQFFFTLCNSGIADTDIIVTISSTDPEIVFTSSTVNFASIDGEGTCLDNLSSPIEFIIPEIETARIDSFFITIESNNGALEGPTIFVRTIGSPSILL